MSAEDQTSSDKVFEAFANSFEEFFILAGQRGVP